MLRQRLIELLKEDINKIDASRLAIIGNSDPLTYYTILLSISSGFGFYNKVYWIKIDEDFSPYSIFDWKISSDSTLEKMITKKFPGAELEIWEIPANSIYTITKLLNPTAIIDTSRSPLVKSLLKDSFNYATSTYVYGDSIIFSLNLNEKVPKDIFYKEGGHLGYLLASTYAVSQIISKVITGKKKHKAIIALLYKDNKIGEISKKISRKLVVGGAGAMSNWFFEAVLPYLENNEIYIIDGDKIEDHNVLRQQFYYVQDVEGKKAEVLSERIQQKAEHMNVKIKRIIPINDFLRTNNLLTILNKINTVENEKIDVLSFIDNEAGMYCMLKLGENLKSSAILAYGLSKKDYSNVIIKYDLPKTLLEKENLNVRDTGRHSCLNPGSIVIPQGVGGVLSVISILNGIFPIKFSFHLPDMEFQSNLNIPRIIKPKETINYAYIIERFRNTLSKIPYSLIKILKNMANGYDIKELYVCVENITKKRTINYSFNALDENSKSFLLKYISTSMPVIKGLAKTLGRPPLNIYDGIYIAMAAKEIGFKNPKNMTEVRQTINYLKEIFRYIPKIKVMAGIIDDSFDYFLMWVIIKARFSSNNSVTTTK